MKKQEMEELRRLEEELLADVYDEAELEDELALLEDTWQEFADLPVDAYNSDQPDVDPKAFSEEVYRGKQKAPVFPLVLIVLLICVVLFCILKLLEVL